MNKFITFTKKEFLEIWRANRLLVLGVVFVFIALIAVLLTRYANEILNALLSPEEMAAFGIGEGAIPHWSNSYEAFFGNLNQIGMVALILMVMGVVVSEKRRGTAALMMVKGLGHSTFILAKFFALSLLAFVTLLASLLINHFLTISLFGAGAEIGNLMMGFLLYWLFAMMMLSLIILTSSLAKSLAMSAVFGFLGFMALSIPSSLPRIREAFPYTISFRATEVATRGYFSDMLWLNILTAAATTAIFLGASIFILRKKEL